MTLPGTGVTPSFPAHTAPLIRESGAQQKIRKDWQAKEGEQSYVPGKMSFADAKEKQRERKDTGEGGREGEHKRALDGSTDGERSRGEDDDELGEAQRRQARGCGKQEGQVLGPAFAELSKAAVHAGAHAIVGIAEEDGAAGYFDGTRKGDVLQKVGGDGGVASDGVIGLA